MAKLDTKDKYFEGIGRRKTATARVRLYKKDVGITINDKTCKESFKTPEQCQAVTAPFDTIKADKGEFGMTVKVSGSGLSAQAEAVRHGLARDLVMIDEEFRSRLRRAGFLTRDSRMVERKKPGLKKARKAPQWSKR